MGAYLSIHDFVMECKPRACSLTLTKKEGMGTSKWDEDEFTKFNSKWNQFAQIKTKTIIVN